VAAWSMSRSSRAWKRPCARASPRSPPCAMPPTIRPEAIRTTRAGKGGRPWGRDKYGVAENGKPGKMPGFPFVGFRQRALPSIVALDVAFEIVQRRRQAREIGGDLLHVLVGQLRHEALHDRAFALAVLVLVQDLHDVVGILSGQVRILGRGRYAVLAVACLADDGLLRAGRPIVRGLSRCDGFVVRPLPACEVRAAVR